MRATASAPAVSPTEDGPYPSYCLVDLVVDANSIKYSYRRNNVRFYVVVREQDLVGPGTPVDCFRTFLAAMGDPEVVFEFEQWVLSCLDEFMKIAAPIEDVRKRVTLWDYYTARAYAFHLVNVRGQLCPVQDRYDPAFHGNQGPRTTISASLSEDDSYQSVSSSTVLRSSLPSVPHYLASQLERVSDGLASHEMSNPPRKVRFCQDAAAPTPSETSCVFFFFKAGIADRGHLREVALLGRIAASHGQFREPFRTSRLAGLVVWDDDEGSLMGLLMDFIPGRTLTAELSAGDASLDSRRKWFAQMESTMMQLHAADIIWGDVKPDNVMINDEGDAVLVDFGGGYTPRYIPRSMHETIEGDLMGMRKIRAEMNLG
ncbi:hypothetical protein PWT90_04492 [Aphanocladium album]|nr:hypothetical protein PWT90_04492 [Aphanocladium album]